MTSSSNGENVTGLLKLFAKFKFFTFNLIFKLDFDGTEYVCANRASLEISENCPPLSIIFTTISAFSSVKFILFNTLDTDDIRFTFPEKF